MDLQSTFDYLMQIRKKEYAIKRKQLRCEELRSCLGARAIQYDRDRVQTSPVDKVSEIICKVTPSSSWRMKRRRPSWPSSTSAGCRWPKWPRSSTTASGGRTTSGSRESYIWGRRWAGIKSRQTLQKRTCYYVTWKERDRQSVEPFTRYRSAAQSSDKVGRGAGGRSIC